MFNLDKYLEISGEQKRKEMISQLGENLELLKTMPVLRDHLICKDGATISVQAGAGLYCDPRLNWASSYSAVEVGYPTGLTESDKEMLWPFSNAVQEKLYFKTDSLEDWQNTIFPYVPSNIVEAIVDAHGGLADHSELASDEEIEFVKKIFCLE